MLGGRRRREVETEGCCVQPLFSGAPATSRVGTAPLAAPSEHGAPLPFRAGARPLSS